MKLCPICLIVSCQHEKRFYNLGLHKILLIQKSLNATINIFSTLISFLSTDAEMQINLSIIQNDLKNCKEKMNKLQLWFENKGIK